MGGPSDEPISYLICSLYYETRYNVRVTAVNEDGSDGPTRTEYIATGPRDAKPNFRLEYSDTPRPTITVTDIYCYKTYLYIIDWKEDGED